MGKNRKIIVGVIVAVLIVIGLIFVAQRLGDNTTSEQGGQPQDVGIQAAQEEKDKQAVAIAEAKEKGLLLLVNKENPVDENYKPTDLEPIRYYAEDRTPAARYMRKEAADHFHAMVESAREKGFDLVMTTAYRDYSFQKTLYDNYVANEGQEAADRFSAEPGKSEHQTGLAVDITSPVVNYQLSDSFGETEEGKWLANHGHEFGFILRFPEDKTEITGYQYEPWHFRYVGKDIAQELFKNKLTLEEFIDKMED